jgi:hypothetical protein
MRNGQVKSAKTAMMMVVKTTKSEETTAMPAPGPT